MPIISVQEANVSLKLSEKEKKKGEREEGGRIINTKSI